MPDESTFNGIYKDKVSGVLSNGYKKNAKSATETDQLNVQDLNKVLRSNGFYSRQYIADHQYSDFNRFGYLNPYTTDTSNREYLFFTKPDLNIFGENDSITCNTDNLIMNSALRSASTLFATVDTRYRPVLKQLQYHADLSTPFMCLLSNRVASSLEMPSISTDNNESSANIYGTTIAYRGHSYKSNQGHSFTLSFKDSKYLEVYMLAKLYDEYHTLMKLGYIQPKTEYIENRILDDQFSIYKIVVGEDGETILYYAKFTGVFITDVPRGDMGEIPQDGITFSLSFYSQFVKDMDPYILVEFNRITPVDAMEVSKTFSHSYGVNNTWVNRPHIEYAESEIRGHDGLDKNTFKLKWYNTKK